MNEISFPGSPGLWPGSSTRMKKDYYRILRITRKATPEIIKKAYRKEAKRHHPDISPKDEEKFREIQEAYETLSDPEKKARYDQEISTRTVRPHSRIRSYYSYSPEHFVNLFDFFGGIDLIFFDGPYFPIDEHLVSPIFKSHETRGHSLEITLTRGEAAEGCKIPLNVPIVMDCSRCGGIGRARGMICGLCRGKGSIRSEEKILLTIPSNVRDGSIIDVPVRSHGTSAYLHAMIRIEK